MSPVRIDLPGGDRYGMSLGVAPHLAVWNAPSARPR
jgi:hypothetical protein